MLWLVTRLSKPGTPDSEATRDPEVRRKHREYLQNGLKNNVLVLSGPMESEDGSSKLLGTVFLLHVKSRAEAQKFLDDDPFTQAGWFHEFKITPMRKGNWNPAAAEGA